MIFQVQSLNMDNNDKRKINRILLIFPHRISRKGYKENLVPPLGIAYIAAVMEKENYQVKILDLAAEDFDHSEDFGNGFIIIGLSYPKTRKLIEEYSPDIVGVSCLFSTQFKAMTNLCRMVKEINPAIVTVVGGEHPSALPRQSLQNPYVDYVGIGEGEYVFRDLVDALNRGADVSGLDGLGYKKDGEIFINPKTQFIDNLDELPMPARHLLPMHTYFKVNLPQGATSLRTPNTSLLTSRGCKAKCVFCASTHFWGPKYRERSPENVLAEIELLVKEYGVKEISFLDDNLTYNKKRAMAIFQGMIDRKYDLVWSTPQGTAVYSMDEELLDKMKESGCYEVTFAVESGDQEVLKKIIKKPLNLDRIKGLVKHAKKAGMLVKGYFVLGLPGETKELMKKSIRFARKMGFNSAGIFIATPLPGTELYKICQEKGYLVPGFDFETINFGIGNIQTPDFTPKDVETIVSRGTLSVNLSLIYKNPFKFIKKYGLMFITSPKGTLQYVWLLIKKSLAPRSTGNLTVI